MKDWSDKDESTCLMLCVMVPDSAKWGQTTFWLGSGAQEDPAAMSRNLASASSALHGLLRKLGAGLDDLLPGASLTHSRLKGILAGLRADGEEGRQLEALSSLVRRSVCPLSLTGSRPLAAGEILSMACSLAAGGIRLSVACSSAEASSRARARPRPAHRRYPVAGGCPRATWICTPTVPR